MTHEYLTNEPSEYFEYLYTRTVEAITKWDKLCNSSKKGIEISFKIQKENLEKLSRERLAVLLEKQAFRKKLAHRN